MITNKHKTKQIIRRAGIGPEKLQGSTYFRFTLAKRQLLYSVYRGGEGRVKFFMFNSRGKNAHLGVSMYKQ